MKSKSSTLTMTPNTKQKIEQVLGFPTSGSLVNGVKIRKAESRLDGNTFQYKMALPKGTNFRTIPNLLRTFYNTELVTIDDDDYVIRNHDYTNKVTSSELVVSGQLDVIPLVKTNPVKKKMTALEDFDSEYSKMEMSNPDTFFRMYPYRTFNSPAMRKKMFSFVSNMGENYGYCDDKNIYYRRASLIMPKIKITKAPEKAKMMYHTHPKNDEPSLSSADDYLLYFDMSHEPRNIRHFFTVMADRMDYFHITPKKDKKNDYVKINEDKFIDELDAQIDVIGKKLDETTPSENYDDDLYYCEKVTREVVKWLNNKYSKYFKIKYKCYYKVRKNPGKKTYEDLHLNDEYIAKPLNDIKSGKYSWPDFDDSEKISEQYAYWHSHFFINKKDNAELGYFRFFPGDERRFSHFMSTAFHGTNFSYWDILGILLISHDIRRNDSKVRDGKEEQTRIEEILEYIGIEEDVIKEDIIMLDSVLQGNVYTDTAKTLAGDHYFLLPLADFSIRSVDAMTDVKMGRRELDSTTYDIMVVLSGKMSEAVAQALGELNDKTYRPIPDEDGNVATIPPTLQYGADDKGKYDFVPSPESNLKKVGVNPPIRRKRADFESTLPQSVFKNIDMFKQALEEKYDPQRFDPTKTFGTKTGKAFKYKYNLIVPYEDTAVTMLIQSSTGNVQMFVPAKGFDFSTAYSASQIAEGAFREVCRSLNEYGLKVPMDDIIVGTTAPARNPRENTTAVLTGKSTVTDQIIEQLKVAVPDSHVVTVYTTEEIDSKRKHFVRVSEEEFNRLEKDGRLLVMQIRDGVRWGYDKEDMRRGGVVLVHQYDHYDDKLLQDAIPDKKTFVLSLDEASDKHDLSGYDVAKKDKESLIAFYKEQGIKNFQTISPKWAQFRRGTSRKHNPLKAALKEILDWIPKSNPKKNENLTIFGDGSSHYMTAQTIPITALSGHKALESGNRISISRTNPPQKIGSVVSLMHPLDKEACINAVAERMESEPFKEKEKDLRTKYNWRGRTPESYFNAIAKQIDSEISDFEKIKMYRGAITLPLGKTTLAKEWNKVGLGTSWSTYKEGADVYMWRPSRIAYGALFGLYEAVVHHSAIDWVNTFMERAAWFEERELALFDQVFVKTFKMYDINWDEYQRPDWSTTGMNLQPWNKSPKKTYTYNKFFPVTTQLSEDILVPTTGVVANPSTKIPKSIRIEESPNKEKKLVAYFFDENDKKIRTVHFGARGMSDYTQHKDPKRMERYLARHRNMGEDWENPMTAGALSRWILWGEPSLRDSFNKFKAMFGLEGVMAVTNTRMNPQPSMDEVAKRVFSISEAEQKDIFARIVKLMEESGELAEEVLIKHGYKSYKDSGVDGIEGEVADAILVLMSVYETNGGDLDELIKHMDEKSSKWESKVKDNPPDPIKVAAITSATAPTFKHHKWYLRYHLDVVMDITNELMSPNVTDEEKRIMHDMVWMHDYPKMKGDPDNFEIVRELVTKHRGATYADELVGYLEEVEALKSPDFSKAHLYSYTISTADALSHYTGPFFQYYIDENPDMSMDEIKASNLAKLEKDKVKLRLPGYENALDNIKFKYGRRKVKVSGLNAVKGNPPISQLLSEVDRTMIDLYKREMKQISGFIRYGKYVVGIFELPVYYKKDDGYLSRLGTTRIAFYPRSGEGSAARPGGGYLNDDALMNKALRYWSKFKADPDEAKYALIGESPFIRNVVGEELGSKFGMTFDKTLWMPIFGENTGGGYGMHMKWFIKANAATAFGGEHHKQDYRYRTPAPLTVPPFPTPSGLLDFSFEDKFNKSRFGHRSLFYASVALSEMYPEPKSVPDLVVAPFSAEVFNKWLQDNGAVRSLFATTEYFPYGAGPGYEYLELADGESKSNPPSKVILVSGPSGAGKSTIAREIANSFDTNVIPTYTTRPLRPNEKDRVHVSEQEFLKMIEDGEFIEHTKQKNGHHYGRKKSDFSGVSVVEVSLNGANFYRKEFPEAYAVYIEPDVSGEALKQRLIKRGGMSEEEAEWRVKITPNHIADAKKMEFDAYKTSVSGKFSELAQEIKEGIPLKNPITQEWGLKLQDISEYPTKLYHGTAGRHMPKIMKEGLVPQKIDMTQFTRMDHSAIFPQWAPRTSMTDNMYLAGDVYASRQAYQPVFEPEEYSDGVIIEIDFARWYEDSNKLTKVEFLKTKFENADGTIQRPFPSPFNFMGREIAVEDDELSDINVWTTIETIPPEYLTIVAVKPLLDRNYSGKWGHWMPLDEFIALRETQPRPNPGASDEWRHGTMLPPEENPFAQYFDPDTDTDDDENVE